MRRQRAGRQRRHPARAAGRQRRARQSFVPYCSVTTTQTCPNGSGCPAGQTCRTAVGRYWAYGVRNSFGLAIDPVTGDLWDTENGPGSFDEINRVVPGMNSGWTPIMGPDARDPEGVGNLFAMPGGASAYSDRSTRGCRRWRSPASSSRAAARSDRLRFGGVVGDFNVGQLYRLPLNAGRTAFDLSGVSGLEDLVATARASATWCGWARLRRHQRLERAPDGSIYIASVGGGAIYRLRALNPPTATPTVTATPTPFAVSGTVQFFAGTVPVPSVTVVATERARSRRARPRTAPTPRRPCRRASGRSRRTRPAAPTSASRRSTRRGCCSTSPALGRSAGAKPRLRRHRRRHLQHLRCDHHPATEGAHHHAPARGHDVRLGLVVPAATGTGAVPDADPAAVERWHDVPDGRDRLRARSSQAPPAKPSSPCYSAT
jgi:hypothetical protein